MMVRERREEKSIGEGRKGYGKENGGGGGEWKKETRVKYNIRNYFCKLEENPR